MIALLPAACQKENPGKDPPAKVQAAAGEDSGKVDFPGTMEGARALLLQFLDPKIDKAALTKKLRPQAKDFKSVFKGGAAKQAYEGYLTPWDKGKILVRGKPDQTELLLWSATTEDLQNGTGDAGAFPGGYSVAAPHFKDGLTFYRFKFVRPGDKLGFAWDGLIYVNGHWVIFPKPWRVLPQGG
jgi:hypothetical protein